MGTIPTPPNNPSPDELKGLVESLRDVVSVMSYGQQQMQEVLSSFTDMTKEAKKQVEGVSTNFKTLVLNADSLKESMQEVVGFAKQIKTNLGGKTFGDAAAHFKTIRENSEKLLRTGKASVGQTIFLERSIRACDAALSSLNKGNLDMSARLKTNVALFEEMKSHMEEIAGDAAKFAGHMEGMKFNRVTKAITGINSLLGRTGNMEKVVRAAQNAHEIKARRGEKAGLNKRLYQDRKTAYETQLVRQFGTGILDANGELDLEKLKKMGHPHAEALASSLGTTPFSRKAISMALNSKGKGAGGWLAKKVMGWGAAGGGDVVAGMGGVAESGLAGMGELAAGPLGVAAAAGLVVKDVFDKVAKQNQEFEKSLGKGGIFTGTQGGAEALQNVKANLRAWGFNGAGITTERQLKVAQAMSDSGTNISELADNDRNAAMRSGFGQISDMVFKQAREVGLTDEEGAKQSLKMLQTYHMTFDQTKTFFSTVGKDIRASGISTSKYLELIDDVTSQFNSMSKSIGNVTTVLRTLGVTGTSTYDVLKENVTAVFGDNSRTLEQNAFLFTRMNSKGVGNVLDTASNEANKTFRDSLTDAITATFDPSKVSEIRKKIIKGLDLNTTAGLGTAYERFNTETGNLPDFKGNTATIGLQGSYQQALAANMLKGVMSGGPANAAAMQKIIGSTPALNMMEQATGLETILGTGGATVGDFLLHPQETLQKNQNATRIASGAQAVGFTKPDDVLHWLEGTNKAIDEVANQLKNGVGGEDTASEFLDKMVASGLVKKQKGVSATEQISAMSSEQISTALKASWGKSGGFNAVDRAELSDPNSPFSKALAALHLEPPQTQEEKIDSIAQTTMTISDRLGTISENIINLVGNPLAILAEKALDSGDSQRYADRGDKTINENLDLLTKIVDADKNANFNVDVARKRLVVEGVSSIGAPIMGPGIQKVAAKDLFSRFRELQANIGNPDSKKWNAATRQEYDEDLSAIRDLAENITTGKSKGALAKAGLGFGFDKLGEPTITLLKPAKGDSKTGGTPPDAAHPAGKHQAKVAPHPAEEHQAKVKAESHDKGAANKQPVNVQSTTYNIHGGHVALKQPVVPNPPAKNAGSNSTSNQVPKVSQVELPPIANPGAI